MFSFKIMKSSFLAGFSAVLMVAAAASFSVSCSRAPRYVSITGYAQGGDYLVKVNLAGSDADAASLKKGIDSILTAFDNSLSGYNPNSLLTRFNAGEAIVPDSVFIEIYRMAGKFYELTGGAVDVSSGALFDIWGFGFTSDSLPSADRINAAMKSSGMDRLVGDLTLAESADGTVRIPDIVADGHPELHPVLNYNAIAQGYSSDLVAGYLRSHGVTDLLVNLGGEIVCSGVNPSGRPWTIGVDSPVDGNNVSGVELKGVLEAGPESCGIVTSGNYRKFYVRDGRKYAHTIDPRTGYPVDHSLLSATIVAGDAVTADALATYCMVLGLEQAAAFIESQPDLEGYLIYADQDGRMDIWKSSGFRLVSE